MKKTISFRTNFHEELIDITTLVDDVVSRYGGESEICCLYALGATAAIMIQENWDPNIRIDVIECLREIIPKGKWRHDRIDGNGDSHIKAGLVGPSEIVPVENGKLLLSTWQNIFFCEFDGPRKRRDVIITLL
ncbi:MAG: secondary thiamine-phosphate synthase enzyme YjbQ [Syntrophales bacterium]|jgi:secondary thiamine-phosphate synthase enzyme|nr:secondary thiamine-phosphate synthase enzyme YjbQ [Syntrophales bacterium]MDY0045524.1 secondary thiamine-phosphate synthase enzyme YjbQ [Syntrophales bacterium]